MPEVSRMMYMNIVQVVDFDMCRSGRPDKGPMRIFHELAAKEATGRMTAPTTDEWNKLVRLGRNLAHCPKAVKCFMYQNASEEVVACTHSDWAGCRRARRSTSGGCIHTGQHMLKFWSKTQAMVALSSAAAELVACSEGESRSSRAAVVVERHGREHRRTCDGRRKCSNWDHPTHGTGKGETPEHELVVGPREGSVRLQQNTLGNGTKRRRYCNG